VRREKTKRQVPPSRKATSSFIAMTQRDAAVKVANP
jgi:hypothetical protein